MGAWKTRLSRSQAADSHSVTWACGLDASIQRSPAYAHSKRISSNPTFSDQIKSRWKEGFPGQRLAALLLLSSVPFARAVLMPSLGCVVPPQLCVSRFPCTGSSHRIYTVHAYWAMPWKPPGLALDMSDPHREPNSVAVIFQCCLTKATLLLGSSAPHSPCGSYPHIPACSPALISHWMQGSISLSWLHTFF